MPHTAVRGFTLIELLITLAIIAILATTAIPSFADMQARLRITSAAENLVTDLHLARMEAIKRNQPIFVVFKNAASADWCYGLDDDPNACDCTKKEAGIGTGNCEIATGADALSRVVKGGEEFNGVLLQKAIFSGKQHTLFDEVRGTASAGTALFKDNGFEAGVKLSGLGRIRTCRTPKSKVMDAPVDKACG